MSLTCGNAIALAGLDTCPAQSAREGHSKAGRSLLSLTVFALAGWAGTLTAGPGSG
jgi:hypothetical protein